MRIKFFLLLFVFIRLNIFAEDIIVLRNGNIIKSNVIEVGTSEIKYKKTSNPNGPLYTTKISDILSITYENGDIDNFSEFKEANESSSPTKTGLISINPTEDNALILNKYNSEYPRHNKHTLNEKKTTDNCYIYWGINENSILCCEYVNIKINKRPRSTSSLILCEGDRSATNEYLISIENKTDGILYIDLANTFSSYDYAENKNSNSWYDNTVYGANSASDKGASLGLGAVASAIGVGGIVGTIANGVSLGGGSSTGASASYQMERILSVPPHSQADLPAHKVLQGKEVIPFYDNFNVNIEVGMFQEDYFSKRLGLKRHELRKFSYEEAPFKRDYYITFSTNPNFNSYFVLPIHLYSRAIYGEKGNTMWSLDFPIEDEAYFIVSRGRLKEDK